MVKNRDQIYRAKHGKVGKFVFDEKVASVFEDMISRSVPGYDQILHLLPTLIKRFQQSNGRYYDLGCSLGAGMLAMAEGISSHKQNKTTELSINDHTIIGIDSSDAMISQATNTLCDFHYPNLTFDFRCEDINITDLSNAAMVLMNFTLQFIALEDRDNLIESIYSNLIAGGGLVISEKIKFEDASTNQTLIDIHHQYKADQGYSELEISQKRDAIENVLIPETLETHVDRLRSAGFTIVTPWVQNLQFVSILAIKE